MRSSEPSWNLQIKECMPLDISLYVRDSLRLEVPGDFSAPGRIETEVPDYSRLLAEGRSEAASIAWQKWWGSLLSQVAALDWANFRMNPDDETLAAALSVLSEDEIYHWRARIRDASEDLAELDSGFSLDQANGIALRISAEREIPMERISGTIFRLVGGGLWWIRVAPNLVICSYHAMRDYVACDQILRAAFAE